MKLVVLPIALAELRDAATYYAAKANAELGLAFVAEFERATNLIANNPKLGAVYRGKYWRYILRRFPYSIVYQATTDEIRIVAVAHQRRRPGYWASRN